MKELTIEHIPSTDSEPSRVRVTFRKKPGAQAQEREAEFGFSVSDEDRRLIQWYLEEFLVYPWGEFITRAREVEDLMTRLGQQLFDAVFADAETRALYSHVADDLGNTRIVIHAADPVGISLPWELLRDSTRGDYGDLARLAHAFVRSQPDLMFETPTVRDEGTFNILMVICRPDGPEDDVPFQSVARPLVRLFRKHPDRIHLDVLRPPTFEQLSRVLNEKPNFYHVLHFDGHGDFPQGSNPGQSPGRADEQGLVAFEGEDGKPRVVSGEELGGLLAGKGVPIVLLNACRSGMTRPESICASVGNQLLKAGACGVVGMAYSVYVQTAVRFMARLYEGLVSGEDLARAVTFAREELRAHPQRRSPIGEVELQDWMVPVLFEAEPVSVMQRREGLRLDPSVLEDQPARAGAEVDCPGPPAYGFVGRDGVTLDLERAFQTEDVVLLQGMAGVGKTEMAVGFARWLAETGGLDGPIFFFKFENYLPLAHVYDRVGQVFNEVIRGQLGQEWHLLDAEKRRRLALDILKKVPCLMIWDNFEPVRGFPKGAKSAWSRAEQEELSGFLSDLRGGQTKVLITSRRDEDWLGKTYRRVELGGLKLVEAQELALRVLRRAGLDTEQIRELPNYNVLLEYLQGNPLAIQVILSELRRTSPETLLDSLQSGAATFREDDPKQGRERSLTASLTYRLDALDTTLRKRLGILALFQGFVNAQVLAAMCQEVEDPPEIIGGMGREDWTAILDSAAEVGLLRRVGEGFYTLHPALPWFFHDLMKDAFPDHEEWLERAFVYAYSACGRSLEQLFHNKAELAMSLLRAEEDNLMHALGLAGRYECWDETAGILYGISRLLVTQGRWVEWERLITGMESDVTDAHRQPLQGREHLWLALLGHRSEMLQYRRDFDGAEAVILRLKDHCERAGDDRNVAVALHQLGIIAQERRQFDEAERWYRQSLAIKERIGDEHGQASNIYQLGKVAEERGKIPEAISLYERAETIVVRLNDPYHLNMVRESLARVKERDAG